MKTNRALKTVLLHLAAGLLAPGLGAVARGQTYEQVAPKTPPAAETPAVLPEAPPAANAAGNNDDRAIGPALKGIVFLGDRAALQPGGVESAGIAATGVALLETEEFRAMVTPFLGRPLTVRLLNEVTREVVLYFRRHDRPVVDVFAPEQNVSSGTVQIVVLEGRLGEVRVEGSLWFATGLIASSIRLHAGDTIPSQSLLEDLAWINQNPFRQADLVFARGQKPGETDIVLRMQDKFPLRAYVGYEDSGNALTDFDRVLAGVNWGNAFGLDQQFNYQLTASPDFKKLVAHSASYVVPIARLRHTLTIFGSFADSRPELSGGAFALKGRSWQLGIRYRMPLPARGKWSQAITAGADFKRSNNNLSFGGMQVFAQENDVAQGIFSYDVSRADVGGTTSGAVTLAFSPGGLTAGNHTAAYQAARSGAEPDYFYAQFEWERLTQLPQNFSWVLRGTAQIASANLLGSEQLGLGGATTVRGYEEREANGDNGILVVNELRGPPLHPGVKLGAKGAADRLEPLVFFDYGVASSHRRLAGEPSRLELASAGVGMRYSAGGFFSLRADYGWQLKDSGVSDLRRDQRGHVSAVVSF